ncbi:MAG: helix-turn-helix transcriptional regulator [Bacteroidota bacterium]
MKNKALIPEQLSQQKKYQAPKEICPEHQEFLTNIGLGLQALRKEKNISISHLSDALGISRNKYAQMEEGRLYFNLLSVLQVLDYYHVNPENFFKKI